MTEKPAPFSKREKGIYFGLFLSAVCIWLGPITWVGWTHKRVPHAGRYLNNQYRVACLFTNRIPSWSTYYGEYKLAGQTDWVGFELNDYSEMKPFGYTNRLHRIVSKARNDSNKEQVLGALAYWIKGQYEERQKDQRVDAIRFSMVRHQVGDPVMAKPDGHWKIIPFDQTSAKDRKVIGAVIFPNEAR